MRRVIITAIITLSILNAGVRAPNSKNQYPSIRDAEIVSSSLIETSSRGIINEISSIGDSVSIFFDDFEGDVSGWTYNGQWTLTTANSYSPTHSFVADDNPAGATYSNLISPVISLPAVNDIEQLAFEFALLCDLPDSDGDNDIEGILEDYYFVKVADTDLIPWHRSGFNAYDGGMSWWCGLDELQGYDDGWLQFLDTDPITLPAASANLDFNLKYALESPASDNIDGCAIDGWDVANVRISTDGGSSWTTLVGTPAYEVSSGFGWSYNNDGCDVPGWGGSSGGWTSATFDLSAYANQSVIIRLAFGSDGGYSTPDAAALTGFFVDNILVSTSTDTLFFNDASTDDGMHANGRLWTDLFYDYNDPSSPRPGSTSWEIYQEGMQFNGSLDLTSFAGKDIQLMWRSRVDDNTDGGDGTGLHIDDVSVYKQVNLTIPAPVDIMAQSSDGRVGLNWSDLNQAQTVDFNYGDGEYDSFIPNSVPWTSGEIVGSGWAARYETFFQTKLTKFSYVLSSGNLTSPGSILPIKITVWDANNVIIFQSSAVTPQAMDALQEYDLSSENILVSGSFYVGWTYTDISAPYVAIDGNSASAGEAFGWHPDGAMVKLTGGLDGNYALFAEGTTISDGGFTYNVYRRLSTEEYGAPLNTNPLTSPSYIDSMVTSGFEYYYAISSVYQGEESELSEEVYAFPESPTVYTIAHDDGTSESAFNIGAGGYQAVKFTPTGFPSLVKRVSIYSSDIDAGSVSAIIWDDDGTAGLPATELFRFDWTGLAPGWNTWDLTDDSIWVEDGSFYFGIEESNSTPAIGMDTDSYQGNSFYGIDDGSGLMWDNFSSIGLGYNIMFRASIDRQYAITSIEEVANALLPNTYRLEQNYPNPFNPETEIRYSIPESGLVEVALYDINGRKVEQLVKSFHYAGSYSLHMDGSQLSSGLYIYTLTSNNVRLSQKMILLK